MSFQETLRAEFEQRHRRNPRYSLRAFARDLRTDHSTLSQILRNRRNLSPRMVRRFGGCLRLDPAVVSDVCQEQHAQAILRLVRSLAFRPS
jgi:plasmid maintenance system antidote protein VapI